LFDKCIIVDHFVAKMFGVGDEEERMTVNLVG